VPDFEVIYPWNRKLNDNSGFSSQNIKNGMVVIKNNFYKFGASNKRTNEKNRNYFTNYY
jgi:hypothetical protein